MSLSHTIKDQLTLTQVAEKFNVGTLTENGRCDCPFCFGTKSMKTTRDQYFKCFKCGSSGSVFDLLIQGGKAKDFQGALAMLRPLIQGAYNEQRAQAGVLNKLWTDLQRIHSQITVDWLGSRGIPLDRVPPDFLEDFGYWSPSLTKLISRTYTTSEKSILEKYGLLPSNRFEGRVLIPIKNLSGQIVHFTGRSLDKESEFRWLHTKGDPPINNYLYQLHTVAEQEEDYVILCEGITDSMSLRALGEPALGCFGVNITLTQHAWALKDKISHLVVVLDRDKYPLGSPLAGRYKSWSGMIPNLIDLAVELKIPIFCCMVPNWSGVKDVNDFLNAVDFDLGEFKRHLANNSRLLTELALDMYLELPEEHDRLWSLFKHIDDPNGLAKLQCYIESRYNGSWTEYLLARAV